MVGEHRVEARYIHHGGIFSYAGDVKPSQSTSTRGSPY